MTAGFFYDDPAHLYGETTRLYDSAPATYDPNRLQFRFEVAWSAGEAYYSDANGLTEAVKLIDCYWNRGRQNMINYDGKGLQMFAPGRMIVTLINDDGTYDPNNTLSTLYPNIVKLKLIRYGVRLNSSSTYTWRFTGYVKDVRSYQDTNGAQYVELTIQDGWGWMQDKNPALPTQTDANPNTIIPKLLNLAQWPKGWLSTDLDAALQALPYFWSANQDLRTSVSKLAEVQADHFYLTADGAVHYKKRTNVFSVAATLAQANILKNVLTANPADTFWNYVRMSAVSTANYSNQNNYLWGDNGSTENHLAIGPTRTMAEQQIAAGATLVLEGQYSDTQVFAGSQPPLGFSFLFGFPYTNPAVILPFFKFFSGTGSTGIDITGYITLLAFLDTGKGFKATLQNTYSGTAFSSWMTAAGFAGDIRSDASRIVLNVDLSSGSDQKQFTIDNPYMIYSGGITWPITTTALYGDMKKIANYYSLIVSSKKILPIIELENKPTIQFRDVYDRVTVTLPRYGISDDFRVGYISERWLTPNGQAIKTTINTEPYVEAVA